MPGDMLGHEGRDEIIAVVISGLRPDFRLLPVALARFDQQSGLELFGQEIVRLALIDEQVGHAQPLIEQGARVIGVPLLAVVAEVARQRLLAPRALRRRDDRREGRHRTKAVLTPQPDRSEEHTSELQSLMRISYAVFCLQKTTNMN